MAVLKYKAKTENGEEWLSLGVKILGEVGGGKKYLHCLNITYDEKSFYLLNIPTNEATPITTTEALYEFFIKSGITKETYLPLSGQIWYDTDDTFGIATYLIVHPEKEGLFADGLWGTKLLSDTLYQKSNPAYGKNTVVVDTVIEF